MGHVRRVYSASYSAAIFAVRRSTLKAPAPLFLLCFDLRPLHPPLCTLKAPYPLSSSIVSDLVDILFWRRSMNTLQLNPRDPAAYWVVQVCAAYLGEDR